MDRQVRLQALAVFANFLGLALVSLRDRKEEEAEFFHIADGDMRQWEDVGWGSPVFHNFHTELSEP